MATPSATEKPQGITANFGNFLLLFTVIGAVLACIGVWFSTSKFTSNWRELEPAPTGAVKIVGGGINYVYVQDQDGQVYSCDIFQYKECWIPVALPSDLPKIEDCDQSHTAFQFYQKPPSDMISCIQFYFVDPHFSGTIILAMNKNGEMWEWQHGSMEYGILLYPIGFIGGAVAGLVLGSLIWIAVRIIRKVGR